MQYLVAVDRKDEALATLNEAATLLEVTAPMTLAIGFEQLGNAPRALELAEKARAARPEDPATLRDVAALQVRLGHPVSAEPLLRQLLALGAKAPSESAWARRMQAGLLAPRRGLSAYGAGPRPARTNHPRQFSRRPPNPGPDPCRSDRPTAPRRGNPAARGGRPPVSRHWRSSRILPAGPDA